VIACKSDDLDDPVVTIENKNDTGQSLSFVCFPSPRSSLSLPSTFSQLSPFATSCQAAAFESFGVSITLHETVRAILRIDQATSGLSAVAVGGAALQYLKPGNKAEESLEQ